MKRQVKKILFTGILQVETVTTEEEFPNELYHDDLLLETEMTLVSPGTEMDCLNGRGAGGAVFPVCLGYSAVCRVLETGTEATEFKAGDRVLVYHSRHASLMVKNKSDVVPIPEKLSSEEAVFAVVGAMGLQGTRKTKIELGIPAMVMGLGLLGQVALQGAALSGAYPLIGLDFNPARRQLALESGADYAFSPDEPGLTEKIKEITRGGVLATVEVTGNPQALLQALACSAPLARVALTGCSRTPTREIDFYHLVHCPGIEIIGGHNFVRPRDQSRRDYWTMRDDMRMIMDFTAAGKMNTSKFISVITEPENAKTVYQRFIDRDPGILGAVFKWQ